ncbi:unnamed protein product [Mycena citricolor]|uniref:Uncharacterized protein n=1 Tax=Mycena citricolor TaxID=2018698 RepID=A0AAD2K255_9AGAR|nr:unnamed protein product [Mycena citricolor]
MDGNCDLRLTPPSSSNRILAYLDRDLPPLPPAQDAVAAAADSPPRSVKVRGYNQTSGPPLRSTFPVIAPGPRSSSLPSGSRNGLVGPPKRLRPTKPNLRIDLTQSLFRPIVASPLIGEVSPVSSQSDCSHLSTPILPPSAAISLETRLSPSSPPRRTISLSSIIRHVQDKSRPGSRICKRMGPTTSTPIISRGSDPPRGIQVTIERDVYVTVSSPPCSGCTSDEMVSRLCPDAVFCESPVAGSAGKVDDGASFADEDDDDGFVFYRPVISTPRRLRLPSSRAELVARSDSADLEIRRVTIDGRLRAASDSVVSKTPSRIQLPLRRKRYTCNRPQSQLVPAGPRSLGR